MSRTIEVPQTQTPVKAHVFFNGSLGKLSCLRGDSKDLQDLAFPFSFVVLDADTHKVGGKLGLEKDAVKFKSTLGHPKYGRSLRVWLENDPENIIAVGTWGAIKNNPALSKAKFTALIFALADFGDGKEICCIHLHGRSYSAWLDATSAKKINPCGDHCFVVKGTTTMSGGKGADSLVPVFEVGKVSAQTIADAQQADFDLQVWLSEQFDSPAAALGIGAAGNTRSAGYDPNNAQHAAEPFNTGNTGNAHDVPMPAIDLNDYATTAQPGDDLPF